MELKEAWRDVYRPTMRREAKVPGNKGTEVVMIDLDGDGIPDPPAPEYEPLVVGDPTVTGQAIVGYTLSCSQPSIEGGSGDVTINYYWQDAANKRVLYMGETHAVTAADIGRTICCQVYVADNQTGESTTVVSNSVGPVNRPVLPEFDVWVNGELHEDPTADVGVEPNGTLVIEVRQMPVSNAPADLTYEWKIRNGTGRLSGDLDGTGLFTWHQIQRQQGRWLHAWPAR